MWNVDPKVMCNQHLLGEHLETHMFVGAMTKGTSMDGFVRNRLLDTRVLLERHNELVREMTARGFKHKSPLPDVPHTSYQCEAIDSRASLVELASRCLDCRVRQNAAV